MSYTHIKNRLLPLSDAAGDLVSSRACWGERRTLLSPTLAFLLQRATKYRCHAARHGLRRGRRGGCVRHRRKHLMLRVRVVLSTVLDRAVVLVLQRTAKVGQRATGGRAERDRGCVAVVVCKQSARTMDRAGNAGGYRLVDRDGARGAVMRRRLVAIAGFPISVALAFALPVSLSFLISPCHLLVLLDGPVSLLVHLAISIVSRNATAAMKILAIHADLRGEERLA